MNEVSILILLIYLIVSGVIGAIYLVSLDEKSFESLEVLYLELIVGFIFGFILAPICLIMGAIKIAKRLFQR